MTPDAAIDYLTGNELSPSTIHLLALERLGQNPDWIDADDEADEIVKEIVSHYVDLDQLAWERA